MHGIEAALVTTEDLRQYKYFTEIQRPVWINVSLDIFLKASTENTAHIFEGMSTE